MEELVQVIFEKPSITKLSNSGIRTIKDRTILAPGFWNGRNYTKEEVIKCFNNTDWNDKDVISLIADHKDDDSKGRPLTIRDWLGFTSNHYLTEDGFIKADLNICDSDLALRLIDGKAPFGISPFVFGRHDELTNSQVDFIIKNNAIVVEPACKESFINSYLSDDKLNEKLEDISAFERIRKRMGMSVSEFYAVPKDPPSSSKLPIFDKVHTQNAMSRFNQTQFDSDEEKAKARNKIISNAKKFGIEIKEFGKLEETKIQNIQGSEHNTNTLLPTNYKKKKTKSNSSKKDENSIELKGGKKMEDNKVEEENNVEESVDKSVEENVESTVEESKEESKEESEDLSEDKIVEQIAKLTERLMNKRKITPEMAKMQKLENEIVSLKNEIKKLSEAKEVKNTAKLSAKPKSVMVSTPKENTDFKGLFTKEISKNTMEAAHKLSSLFGI